MSSLLDSGDGPVAVLPMTFGRNPTMVADVAKTLSWLSTGTVRAEWSCATTSVRSTT
ncbi:hypothetical protein NKG05_03065 [Oerskovia sp. M15]